MTRPGVDAQPEITTLQYITRLWVDAQRERVDERRVARPRAPHQRVACDHGVRLQYITLHYIVLHQRVACDHRDDETAHTPFLRRLPARRERGAAAAHGGEQARNKKGKPRKKKKQQQQQLA